jgi:methionine-rich copper-binding protein CopC
VTRAAAAGRLASGLLRIVLAVVIGAAASLVLAPSSSAHTTLLESNPPDGARLNAPPSQIRLTFTEDLLPQFVVVQVQVDGEEPRELEARVQGAVVVGEVPGELRNGASASGHWQINYRVVAVDGHPVTGSVSLDMAGASTRGPSASPAPSPTPAGPNDLGSEPRSEPSATSPTVWLLAGLAALVSLSAAAFAARSRGRGRYAHGSDPS